MQSDPPEKPEPDVQRRVALPVPRRFVMAGILFLVVLAPLVPDEPMHVSGVMVVLGLASAALGFVSGIGSAIRSEAPATRRAAWLAAASGLLLVVAWLAWWVMKLMSQLG